MNNLLPTPIEQARFAELLNKAYKWGFYEGYFAEFGDLFPIPKSPLSPTQALVLNIDLGSFKKTIKTSVGLIKKEYRVCHIEPPEIKEFAPKTSHPRAHAEWQMVDFGSYRDGSTVLKARTMTKAQDFATTAVFWAIVYKPSLLFQLRKMKINTLWLGGCRLSETSGLNEQFCPYLGYCSGDRRGLLEINRGNCRNEDIKDQRSIPTLIPDSWYYTHRDWTHH